MILKHPDDRARDLAQLEGLLALALTRDQRVGVERELRTIRNSSATGVTSAEILGGVLAEQDDVLLLSDVRIEVDGVIAPLDHLVLTSPCRVHVIEAKSWRGRLVRDGDGRWTAWYEASGIYPEPSPVVLARRHAAMVRRWLRARGYGDRVDVRPAVMLSPGSELADMRGPDEDRDVALFRAEAAREWCERALSGGGIRARIRRWRGKVPVGELLPIARAFADAHRPVLRDWRAMLGIPALVAVRSPRGAAAPEARAAAPSPAASAAP